VIPKLSIIIPHWNGIEVLSECLDSLKKSTYFSFEIIVVDNASSDGSQAWIKANHPDITLIENQVNKGYAGGCNSGVESAKGKYLLFLNNDTIQESNWIEPLIQRLESDETIAAVQPKILNYYQRDLFDYAGGSGGMMDVLGFPFARGRIFFNQEKDQGQYDDAIPIFWASGTAMCVRKTTFQSAGGFDESFFAHMEEIDLSWKIHLMGQEVFVEPRSVVYHKNAVSLPMHSHRKFYLNHRNSLFMILSNYSLPLSLYFFPIRFVLEWVAFFYALVKLDYRHMTAILRALVWILFHPHKIIQKRRKISRLRQRKDKELLKRFYKGSLVLDHYLLGKKKYSDFV
jgi:hypothetical protein